MLNIDRVSPDLYLAASPDLFQAFVCWRSGGQILIAACLLGNGTMATFSHEVYSTVFWSATPEQLMQEVVEVFKHTADPTFPIELVYEFGGSINNELVTIAALTEVH